jgi:iron complex transport system ATP-binding protein
LKATSPLISLSGFSLQIGGRRILDRISLTVEAGEFVSVIGPNGAGKTTLLKCLDGILRGGEGRIEVKGRPLSAYSSRELARLISYVPPGDGTPIPFTVREFVLLARYPHLSPFSSGGKEDREAVWAALEATGTGSLADRYLDTLSGGERQKVLIAAALAQGGEILLLDEPTAFLDPKHEEEVYRILVQINREGGRTVISVTHDLNHALLVSKRILALKGGSVLFFGPPQIMVEQSILELAFEKSFRYLSHPDSGKVLVFPEWDL